MTDATENVWERRWFVLRRYVTREAVSSLKAHNHRRERRPYLHMYAHSNEIEEIGVISLTGVNVESNPEMEALLGVCLSPHALRFNLTRRVQSRKSSPSRSSPLRIRTRSLRQARRSFRHGLRSWIPPGFLHDALRTLTTRNLVCILFLSSPLALLVSTLRFMTTLITSRSLCSAYCTTFFFHVSGVCPVSRRIHSLPIYAHTT